MTYRSGSKLGVAPTSFLLTIHRNETKTLNICSDFRPRHSLSGLRRGFFVMFDVTLPIIFYFTFSRLIRDKNRKRYA